MTDNDSSLTPQSPSKPEMGRNEPCPCGSGKKYKRCHGVAAAPKLSQPKAGAGGMPAMPPGMENMDPAMMSQAAQMLQRLPRGQLQKLQSIMQRAMAGKDVAREAEEFQRTLPPEFQQMLGSFAAMAGAGGLGAGAPAAEESSSMSEEEARAIVAQAAKEGKLSEDQAESLLKDSGETEEEKKSGFGKLWKKITR